MQSSTSMMYLFASQIYKVSSQRTKLAQKWALWTRKCNHKLHRSKEPHYEHRAVENNLSQFKGLKLAARFITFARNFLTDIRLSTIRNRLKKSYYHLGVISLRIADVVNVKANVVWHKSQDFGLSLWLYWVLASCALVLININELIHTERKGMINSFYKIDSKIISLSVVDVSYPQLH